MLRVKPGDCGNATTSRSCKIASCKVSIKQKKDVILVAEDRVYTVEITVRIKLVLDVFLFFCRTTQSKGLSEIKLSTWGWKNF
jgi:hypothetical protein